MSCGATHRVDLFDLLDRLRAALALDADRRAVVQDHVAMACFTSSAMRGRRLDLAHLAGRLAVSSMFSGL
jgi:hypothetical protein